MGVIGASADQTALDLEARYAFRVEPLDDALDLSGYFRTDAVAWQEQELVGCHEPIRVALMIEGVWRRLRPGPRFRCLALEIVDMRRFFQRQPDIVEPVEQAMLAEGIEVECHRPPSGPRISWFGRSMVSVALEPRSASSNSFFRSSGDTVIGRMPFLKQLL